VRPWSTRPSNSPTWRRRPASSGRRQCAPRDREGSCAASESFVNLWAGLVGSAVRERSAFRRRSVELRNGANHAALAHPLPADRGGSRGPGDRRSDRHGGSPSLRVETADASRVRVHQIGRHADPDRAACPRRSAVSIPYRGIQR
jgi:hypothetical protein